MVNEKRMTYTQMNREIRRQLADVGIENAAFEAAELLCWAAGISKETFLLEADRFFPTEALKKLRQAADKRASGYPLQYLLGTWDFYSGSFRVGEGVLIPRSDTEVLCEQTIRFVGEKPMTVLDLCSGSGCIAVTIAKECPKSVVYAIEKSEAAYPYLTENIKNNGAAVTPVLCDALSGDSLERVPDCDVILSNPPYLSEADMQALQKEVTFEPAMALYGDADGLLFYRELTALWTPKLKSGGLLAYEIGLGQEKEVRNILEKHGYISVCEARDLCGIIRTVSGIKP